MCGKTMSCVVCLSNFMDWRLSFIPNNYLWVWKGPPVIICDKLVSDLWPVGPILFPFRVGKFNRMAVRRGKVVDL